MTTQELLAACQSFKPKGATGEANVVSDFAQIVQSALVNLGLYQRDLADDFEVAESTVSRWSSGIAKPHPQIQKLVVAWIAKRAARMTAPAYASAATAPSTRYVAQELLHR